MSDRPVESSKSQWSHGRTSSELVAGGTCASRPAAWSKPQPPARSAELGTPAGRRFCSLTMSALTEEGHHRIANKLQQVFSGAAHIGDRDQTPATPLVAQSRRTLWQPAKADHLVGSSRQMARRALQHPSHGFCCPAPPDVLLEGQDLKLHGYLLRNAFCTTFHACIIEKQRWRRLTAAR